MLDLHVKSSIFFSSLVETTQTHTTFHLKFKRFETKIQPNYQHKLALFRISVRAYEFLCFPLILRIRQLNERAETKLLKNKTKIVICSVSHVFFRSIIPSQNFLPSFFLNCVCITLLVRIKNQFTKCSIQIKMPNFSHHFFLSFLCVSTELQYPKI